ncbi:MAG: type II secretion system protein GspG [Acidobacteriota bacterium]|nr:type II secretion system protein GspG [Acidobacteriota bacterium]
MIAAIAIPNLLNAIDRGRQKRTMADMRSVGTAVEAYSIDLNQYPNETGDIDGNLDQHLEPLYIKKTPDDDGWNNPVQYDSDTLEYSIYSYGKDGADTGYSGGKTTDFDQDIYFVNGSFVQWPEGQQQ